MLKYIVEWSSANGRGNDFYKAPRNWTRDQVRKAWEIEHPGCWVDQLIPNGEVE